MAQALDIDRLLANNPGVDPQRLQKSIEASQKFGLTPKNRYRFNIIPPFAGRYRKPPAAEIGGPDDNIREPQ